MPQVKKRELWQDLKQKVNYKSAVDTEEFAADVEAIYNSILWPYERYIELASSLMPSGSEQASKNPPRSQCTQTSAHGNVTDRGRRSSFERIKEERLFGRSKIKKGISESELIIPSNHSGSPTAENENEAEPVSQHKRIEHPSFIQSKQTFDYFIISVYSFVRDVMTILRRMISFWYFAMAVLEQYTHIAAHPS